jgi:DNA-directed RNA polymerase specialized sigma24 family protein
MNARIETSYSSAELKQFAEIASIQARRFGFGQSDADDVSQLVLIDLVSAPEPVHSPKAWVRKVAARKAWRMKQRNGKSPVHLGSSKEAAVSPDLGGRIDMLRAFSRVPESEANLWFDRRVLRKSMAELVDEGPLSASTVKRRLARTTKQLRRVLTQSTA